MTVNILDRSGDKFGFSNSKNYKVLLNRQVNRLDWTGNVIDNWEDRN